MNQAFEDEDENPKKLSDLNESEDEVPRTHDKTATGQHGPEKRKPGSSKHTDDSHRVTKKANISFKTDQESQVHPSPSEASYPDLFSESSSADDNCLSFSSTSATTTVSSSLVTTVERERERLGRQQRRSARMVNSNRPMLLSHRTFYKMAVPFEFASPVYSPLYADRISFTPEVKLTATTQLVRRGCREM
jgi:hypothetical protein